MSNKLPLVSICCITYNHASYIREALDGFLMQKTNFPFEVLIHDDASTDDTANIIREYEQKHPDIIKPIYQTENQYSKGVSISLTYNFPRAQGKYIAMCEGDDYWTNPLKLQKQVDFLEENEEYIVCFHKAIILNERGEEKSMYEQSIDFLKYELDLKFALTIWNVPTASLLFRNNIKEFPSWMSKVKSGDIAITALLIGDTRLGFINEAMSVYRLHNTGVSNTHFGYDLIRHRLFLYERINEFYNYKYESQIKFAINYVIDKYCDNSNNEITLKKVKKYFKEKLYQKILSRW